jgi:hypothetical protein
MHITLDSVVRMVNRLLDFGNYNNGNNFKLIPKSNNRINHTNHSMLTLCANNSLPVSNYYIP